MALIGTKYGLAVDLADGDSVSVEIGTGVSVAGVLPFSVKTKSEMA